MTPDFSPAMLKGFLRARVKMTAYMAAYPAPPLMVADMAQAETAAMAAIRKHAGVTTDEFRKAWEARPLPMAARLKLWLALGVHPEAHGVRLLDGDGQEDIRNAT